MKTRITFFKIPSVKKRTIGTTTLKENVLTPTIPLKDFYIAFPDKDNANTINEALRKSKHILFTPGVYKINKSISVHRQGTILIGLGLTTLQSTKGNSIIEFDDIGDVIVSSIMLDAGEIPSETLFRMGNKSAFKNQKFSFLYDIYVRVGGPHEGSTKSCVIINSNNVIADNVWLWRADHGNGVGWDINPCANGLIVNGNNVTIYGLFNEHFQEYQTLWNGNKGKVYFYQSEMPYDPPTVDAWKDKEKGGYASYKVSENVNKHEAWGVGVYCVFYKAPINVENAIETPESIEKNMHHTFTFWLNGFKDSSIRNVINGKGKTVNESNRKAVVN